MKSLSFFQMTESLSKINKKFLNKRICVLTTIFLHNSFISKNTNRLIEDPYIRIYSWPNNFVSFSDIIPVEHLKAELKVS